jgi:hypothetical protein
MVNTKLLAKAEYASLGLSALGTILAAATGQAALVATPLTLALSLNLINRQELAKRTQHNKNNISHLKQEFSREINSLSSNINSVQNNLNALPFSEEIININKSEKIVLEIQETTLQLKQRLEDLEGIFNNFSVEKELVDLTQIEGAIASLSQQLNSLDKQFNNILEPRELESRIGKLDLRINVIKNQLPQLVNNESLNQELTKFSEQLASQIDANIEQNIQSFNKLIKETQPAYQYELIFDRRESRAVLLEALETAQKRLILVCPWITNYGANKEVIELSKNFLDREGILEIGWGHLKDINDNKLGNGFYYNALNNFKNL